MVTNARALALALIAAFLFLPVRFALVSANPHCGRPSLATLNPDSGIPIQGCGYGMGNYGEQDYGV